MILGVGGENLSVGKDSCNNLSWHHVSSITSYNYNYSTLSVTKVKIPTKLFLVGIDIEGLSICK